MVTTYFLNVVAGNVFQTQTSPSLPTTYYLGLSTTAPTQSGTNVSEPSSSAAYGRIQLTNVNMSAPANGVCTNNSVLAFQESTANWGTLTHYVVYDAPTGGNLLLYNTLKQSRNAQAGTTVAIRSGELEISVVSV